MEISKGREPAGTLRRSDVRFGLGTVRLGAPNLPFATDRVERRLPLRVARRLPVNAEGGMRAEV